MLFGRLGEPEPRTVHVPPAYKEVTRRIYEQSELPRTIESGFDRLPDGVPALSRFRVALRHDTSIATITVEEYGRDFTAALQRQLHQIALDRFALVALILPLSLPLTGHYGGGLQPLGLSFCGIYPEFDRTGDVLVLQGLNVEPDVESIQLASEFGEWIRDFVVADYRATLDHAERRARSRAHMARIYEAL
jgi:hypothetical protein